MNQPPFDMPSPFASFGIFEIVFWIVFVLILSLVVFFWVMFFFRFLRGKREVQGQTPKQDQPVVVEREVVREIVMIRCPYCGNLYEEKLDTCPHCNAKRS